MTSEQLAYLKANPMETVMKYRAMLLKNQIDKKTYDWIIRQVSNPVAAEKTGAVDAGNAGSIQNTQDVTSIQSGVRTSESGGGFGQAGGREISGDSQKARIRSLLEDGC